MDIGQLKYQQALAGISQSLGGAVLGTVKPILHSMYPLDFEYYMITLELTDSSDNTIEIFTFPIMPSSITRTVPTRSFVKKTATATIVSNSKYFVPFEVSMRGNFGRSFKLLVKPKSEILFKALRFSRQEGSYSAVDSNSTAPKNIIPEFDVSLKNGYGCIKILQSIIDRASGCDERNRPHRLYLYNPALGESYQVIPMQMSLTQDQDRNNMIWEYNLQLTAVSLLKSDKKQPFKGSLTSLLSTGAIQKGINSIGSQVVSNLSKLSPNNFPTS